MLPRARTLKDIVRSPFGELFAGLREAYGPAVEKLQRTRAKRLWRKVRRAPRRVDGQSGCNQHHRTAGRRRPDGNNRGNTCRIQSRGTSAKSRESSAMTEIFFSQVTGQTISRDVTPITAWLPHSRLVRIIRVRCGSRLKGVRLQCRDGRAHCMARPDSPSLSTPPILP